MNRRISSTIAGTTTQFLYNAFGQRVSIWGTASPANQLQEQYFVGNKPVAYFSNSMLHFQHQDWTGTERIRTTYNGAVEGSFVSMPFGDAFSTNGGHGDSYHFAGLDHDYSSNTEHAQFRQYSSMSGRWMSPDPYSGSYAWKNPQSLNRYTYALNNPVSFVDPSGLLCVLPSGYNPSTGQIGGSHPGHTSDVLWQEDPGQMTITIPTTLTSTLQSMEMGREAQAMAVWQEEGEEMPQVVDCFTESLARSRNHCLARQVRPASQLAQAQAQALVEALSWVEV